MLLRLMMTMPAMPNPRSIPLDNVEYTLQLDWRFSWYRVAFLCNWPFWRLSLMVKPLFEIINWIIDYGRIKRLVNTKINQSESSINTFTHLSIIDIIKLLGCNDYKHFSKYMISFNNIKYPQYARPTNNFSSTQQQTQHNNPKKAQLYALSQTIPITANSIIYSP